MPDTQQWWLFFGSVLIFAFLPGPGMLYVLARTVRGGRLDGLRSVAGNGLGALVHAIAAALGLSAVLAASAPAFFVVKIVGAAYLVYLGIQALRVEQRRQHSSRPPRVRGAFVDGIVSEVLNPKTAVFFLALLPHFVDAHDRHATVAMLLLGIIAVVVAALADLLVALAAAQIAARMQSSPQLQRGQRWFSGLTLIGLGGVLVAAEAS